MKILSIFGTRPEAIKMAPVVQQLARATSLDSVVCVTGQHKSMLQQVLDLFGITPDHNLDVMHPNQTLNSLSARIFSQLDPVLTLEKPDRILVHGDTTTAAIATLAAFHHRIPVAHIEAGLRTGNMQQPWPEEMNRRVVDVMCDYLFAPTNSSADNLAQENLSGQIIVTGNTVIDALLLTVQRINQNAQLQQQLDTHFTFLSANKKILLVTGHRRENFGDGFKGICEALIKLSARDDITIVYPVHLNPNVRGPVERMLSTLPNVHLIEPLDYLHFVRLMQLSHVILTDSGGVQEEAPALGKPVLVMRDVTERPEAIEAGTASLVGTSPDNIAAAVSQLFDDMALYTGIATIHNPYGDGHAAQRIVAALTSQPYTEFNPVNLSTQQAQTSALVGML